MSEKEKIKRKLLLLGMTTTITSTAFIGSTVLLQSMYNKAFLEIEANLDMIHNDLDKIKNYQLKMKSDIKIMQEDVKILEKRVTELEKVYFPNEAQLEDLESENSLTLKRKK